MCGRFALTSSPEELAQRFELSEPPALVARYNVAPGQDVWVVRPSQAGSREARALRWGLVPAWSEGPGDARAPNLINARSETAADKAAFRGAFRARRCLIPASGFYEWAARGDFKQPYWIAPPEGQLLAFAGLWESWRDPAGGALESCAILTGEAAGAIRSLHARMPVILPPEQWADWLAPEAAAAQLAELLRPVDPGLRFHPVGTGVNKVDRDDPSCLEPVPEAPDQLELL